jgi:replicative DNA helicase
VPLYVDDRSGVTITDIKRFARSVNRRKPLAGLVVDYLQLMAQPHGDKRPRHEFVADMSRQLKIMAMDMQIPVIALSQLNRASESRNDKMPMLSDLRESGAVEQDADVVILLHREIMGDLRNDLSMLVAKNRHGATGLAQLTFWGHYSKALDQGTTPQNAQRMAA